MAAFLLISLGPAQRRECLTFVSNPDSNLLLPVHGEAPLGAESLSGWTDYTTNGIAHPG